MPPASHGLSPRTTHQRQRKALKHLVNVGKQTDAEASLASKLDPDASQQRMYLQTENKSLNLNLKQSPKPQPSPNLRSNSNFKLKGIQFRNFNNNTSLGIAHKTSKKSDLSFVLE